MIPSYSKFISFQDKRIIFLFYIILAIVLGFYWKNSNFDLSKDNLWQVTVLLTAVLFNFTYELKSYWAYSYTIGRVDLKDFNINKKNSSKSILLDFWFLILIGMVGILAIVSFSLIYLPKTYNVAFIYLLTPIYFYFIYRNIRIIVVKVLLTDFPVQEKYIRLYQYVLNSLLITVGVNLISISPLAKHSEFSLSEGFTSLSLMIAMFILCAIVLVINLIFIKWSKRYVFLGKIFLKEIDFTFSQMLPFSWLHAYSKLTGWLLLLVILAIWIVFISLFFTYIQFNPNFTIYFLFCFFPCIVFYFLQLYWFCHSEFMMACDMYLRFRESEERKN